MFTRKLNSHIAATILFDARESASLEKQNRDVYAELIKVKPENRKALLESLSLDQLKIIQDRINSLKGGTHANLVWRGQVSTEINRLKELKTQPVVVAPAAPTQLAPASALAAAPQLAAAQQVENTAVVAKQAEKITAVKETVPQETSELRGSVGLTAQSEALQKIMKGLPEVKGDKSLTTIIKDLKGVNIVSLLGVIKNTPDLSKSMSYEEYTKAGYTPDGVFGFMELGSMNDFIQAVAKNPELKKQVIVLAAYAEAGLDPTVALRGSKQIEKLDSTKIETVVEYFGDVPSGRYSKDIILKTLNELSKDSASFAVNMARVANISSVTDLSTLVTAIKKDPTAKARFFDNINASAATGVVGLKGFINGKGVERVESVSKVLEEAAKKAVADLENVLKDPKASPEDKRKAQEAKDAFDKKGGTSWLTGEIQKVAQAAFVNVGKDANAIGFGLTYEAFVKGLTVSIGAGLGEGGKIMPAAVIHYGKDAKLGETTGKIIKGNLGVGTSVFPVVIPFVDGGISFTDKVTTIGNGLGEVKSIGVQAQWMKVGGVLMLSRTTEIADEIAQGEAKLMSAVNDMSKINVTEVSVATMQKTLEAAGLKSTPEYLVHWTNRMKELYRVNGVTASTSPAAKAILISGLVQSEVEKHQVQQSQNDKDSRSFKGGTIGVGHIFGITFPIGGLLWKEGSMKYSSARVIESVTETKKSLKFSELYESGSDGKTWTFKKGEKPNKVNIDSTVGDYDAEMGIITLIDTNGVKVSEITEKDGKLDVVTIVQVKEKASEGDVRVLEFPVPLQNSIYVMNRSPSFISFNNAISLISDQKYSEALSIFQSKANTPGTISDIIKVLNSDGKLQANPDRLAVVLSYTYGAKDVKNKKTDLSTLEYKNAHSQGVQNAEKRLAPNSWNAANEEKFAKIEKHTSQPLSQIIPGQDLSVSVYATPLNGKHRIDKFQGSLSVSKEVSYVVTDAQKDGLIAEHSARIASIVDTLKAGITLAGKDATAITIDSYKTMLKSGKLPDAWKTIGIELVKEPVFFEARAMAAGNICMNKTEGIGYPTFKSLVDDKGVTHTITRVTKTTEMDYVGGNAGYSEVISGVFGTAMKGGQEANVENKDFKTEIQTRDVQVSPTNIQVIDGRQVIVVASGGTNTHIPLSSLTRTQAVALSQGQSINLSVNVPVQVPFTTVTPGAIINRSPDAVAVAGIMTTSEVKALLEPMINDTKYPFAEEKSKK